MEKGIEYLVNENGRNTVGLELRKGKIIIKLPIGYDYDEQNNEKDEFKKEIKKLMMLLAKKNKILAEELEQKDENHYDFIASLKVVEDYEKYGLYKQTELKSQINNKGRINWAKTIHQKQIYQKDNIIFTNLVKEYRDYKCEKEIQEIQEFCLYQISKNLGYLLNFSYPKYNKKHTKNEMINLLKKELEHTNEDVKMEMLQNLVRFIEHTNIEALEKGDIAIRCKEFNYIWQELVNVYGLGNEKRQYYNPKAGYYDRMDNTLNQKQTQKVKSSIIDTIVKDFDPYIEYVFVLDAKYYAKGALPGEYDIFKQTRYGEYVKRTLEKDGEHKKIINAFVLPANLEGNKVKIASFYAKCDREQKANIVEDYEKIFVVYVDTRTLIKDTKTTMKEVLEALILVQ